MTTTKIGSGRPQFQLPNNRFDQITRQPLALIGDETETQDEPDSSNRIGTVRGSRQDEPGRVSVAGLEAEPAVVEVPKVGFGG